MIQHLGRGGDPNVGVLLLMMNTSGVPLLDGASIRDVVLQLLLPFGAGQLMRPGSLRRRSLCALVQGGRLRLHPAGGVHGFLDGCDQKTLGQHRFVAVDLGYRRQHHVTCGDAGLHRGHRPNLPSSTDAT